MSKSFFVISAVILISILGAYTLTTIRTNDTSVPVTSSQVDENKNAINSTDSQETNAYSFEEVMTHNSENDCWMVINQKVYDVTGFVSKHPGGDEILLGCGRDATSMFESEREHSSGKTDLELQNLQIGILQ